MNDRAMRALLTQLIEDIDAGRVAVRRPAGVGAGARGVVLAASLSLGVAACGGNRGAVDDPAVYAEYLAPDPEPAQTAEPVEPPPEPVPPPQAEYAAPDPNEPVPPPEPEYAAHFPKPAPSATVPLAPPDPVPAAVPDYAVEAPEPAH